MKRETFDHLQRSILVADDDQEDLRILTEILSTNGYTVWPFADGRQALFAIQNQLPDLILWDSRMPKITGDDVYVFLKACEPTREIPVILISAFQNRVESGAAFSPDAVDYITKPFQAEEILARIAIHFHAQGSPQDLYQEIEIRRQFEDILLEQNQKLALLNQLSTSLEACTREDETYKVMADVCEKLFAGDTGYLALFKGVHDLELVAHWGSFPPHMRSLSLEQAKKFCRASAEKSNTERHVVLEMPLKNVEEPLGFIYLCVVFGNPEIFETDGDSTIAAKQILLSQVSDYYSLVLRNLRLLERLQIAAIHDPLTGLYNRRYMEESLEREVQRAKRRNTPVGIIMIDIDHFKRFNDAYGHEIGNQVLQELGELLRHNTRREDIACRYGGEEFLLILPETTREIAIHRSEELRCLVKDHRIPYEEKQLQVTISLGIAILPGNCSCDAKEAITRADRALYQAKREGRDRVVTAPDPQEL